MKVVTLRMTDEEYALLAALSQANHRSMNGQLLALVTASCSHSASTTTAPPVLAPRQHDDSTVLALRQQDASEMLSTRAGAALDLDLLPEPQPQDQDQTLLSPDGDDSELFDDFWAGYPRHPENGKPGGGASRHLTFKRWKNLKRAEREAAMVGLRHYADDCRRPNAAVAHATTWLNQRRWEDWQEPAQPHLVVVNGSRAGPQPWELLDRNDPANWRIPSME